MKKAAKKPKRINDYGIVLLEEVKSHVMALVENQSILIERFKELNVKYESLSKKYNNLAG